MTVSIGSKITATDYNELVTKTNKIFADNYPTSVPTANPVTKSNQAFGWGNQAATITNIGTKVSANLVNEVVDRLNIGSEHTGGQYELDRVIPGQKITASIWNDMQTVIDDITPKKNSAALGQTAISQLGVISHSTGFNNTLTYVVDLTFSSYNKGRYFFNSGSTIRLNLDKVNGNAAASSWSGVYQRLGTVSLSLTNTVSTTSNIISENKGFEDLDATEQLLLTCNARSGGGYGYGYGYGYGTGGDNSYGYGYGYGYGNGGSSRRIKIYGQLIPASGNFSSGAVTLRLKVVLSSHDTGVTGTHSLYVESNKATSKTSGAASFGITAPSYSGSSHV